MKIGVDFHCPNCFMPYTNPDENQKCNFCGAVLTGQNIVPQEQPKINQVVHMEHIFWGYITSEDYDFAAKKYFWWLKERFKKGEIYLPGDENGPFLNDKNTIMPIVKMLRWIEGVVEVFIEQQKDHYGWVSYIRDLFLDTLYFTNRNNYEEYYAIVTVEISDKSKSAPPFDHMGGNGFWDLPVKMNKLEAIEMDLDDKFGLVSKEGINFELL